MKKTILSPLLGLAIAVTALSFFADRVGAQLQQNAQPNYNRQMYSADLQSVPATLAGAGITNLPVPIQLLKGAGVYLSASGYCTNPATVSTYKLLAYPNIDGNIGTNFATTPIASCTITHNGTNTVNDGTNIAAATLANIAFLKITITNLATGTTNGFTINRVHYQIDK